MAQVRRSVYEPSCPSRTTRILVPEMIPYLFVVGAGPLRVDPSVTISLSPSSSINTAAYTCRKAGVTPLGIVGRKDLFIRLCSLVDMVYVSWLTNGIVKCMHALGSIPYGY